MSTSPQPFRDFLEIAYFITAGPGLLAAAVYGLRSLSLTKESMSQTETRARLTATAEQIRYFAETIAPRFDELEEALTKAEINLADKCEIKLDEEGISVEFTEQPTNLERFAPLLGVFLKARNSLAAWCPYVIHGVADERLAYKNLGMDFLHMASVCIPWIILCDKEESSEDIINLYALWQTRLEAEVLSDMSAALNERAEGLKGRRIHIKRGKDSK